MIFPAPSDYLRSFALAFLAGAASALAIAAYGRYMRLQGERHRQGHLVPGAR